MNKMAPFIFMDQFQPKDVKARLLPCAVFILPLLAMSAFCPSSVWAEDPPTLTGVECNNPNSSVTGWTNTLGINIILEGVSGAPLWVDIDEDPEFGSPTTIDYNNQSDPFIRTFLGHISEISSVVFSPDGTKVLTGSYDNTAKLWDAKSGAVIRTFTGHASWIEAVAFSPDGSKGLTGSNDRTAKLWDAQTGVEIRTFAGHTDLVWSAAFSPDGTKVLTGSWDNTAKLWDAQTGVEIRTFSGHTRIVRSVAFSPDGSKVLTGSDDGTAKLWDAQTGVEIRTFSGHTAYVYSVAFSPDGSKVLTGSWDNTAKLWDAQTGAEVRTFSGHTDLVSSVVFSPDGSKVLTGSDDGTAKLWDAQTGVEIRTFSGHTGLGYTGNVMSVAFSPDGTKVLTGSDDHTAKLWWDWDAGPRFSYNLENGINGPKTIYVRLRNNAGASDVVSATINLDTISPEKPNTPVVANGDWSFDPITFAWESVIDSGSGVASYDCQIGTATGTSDIFDGNVGDVLEKTVTAQIGQTLYCRVRAIDLAGNIGAWSDWSTGILVSNPNPPEISGIEITSDDMTSDGWTTTQDISVSLTGDGNTPIWIDIDEDPEFNSPITLDYDQFIDPMILSLYDGQNPDSQSVDFSPDGSKLLTCGHDINAKLWDSETGAEIRSFIGHSTYISSIAYSPDGTKVLTGCTDGIAKIWDANTGDEICSLNHGTRINSVSFSPDSKLVLLGNTTLWDIQTENLIQTLTSPNIFTLDSKNLLMGSGNSVILWNIQTKTQTQSLVGHSGSIRSLCINDDGTKLLTGSDDKSAILWDLQTYSKIMTFTGHSGSVRSLAFNPDGTKVATGSADNTIKLWDVQTGDELVTFSGHQGIVHSLFFTPDGSKIITCSNDGTARLWDTLSGCQILKYNHLYQQYILDGILSPDGKTFMTCASEEVCTWRTQLQYLYPLNDGEDGLRTVYVRLRNYAGESQVVNATINLDAHPPTGAISINEDDSFTNATAVNLTLSASDGTGMGLDKMRLSSDGVTWSDWVDFSENANWTLSSGDGEKTVYVQYSDLIGHQSQSFTDTIYLDTTGPSGSVVSNNNASYTNSVNISLALSANDGGGCGLDQMRLSNDGVNWTDWEAISSSRAWVLASGDGSKTVRVQYRDLLGNILTYSDSIILDMTNPSGSIVINDNDEFTNNENVTLTLGASDGNGSGISQMRLSRDGENWDTWQSFATSLPWTLSSGDGLQSVYIQYRDSIGNLSSILLDEIHLDTISPSQPSKPIWVSGQSAFNWNGASDPDPGSGVASYDCQIGTWPDQSDVFDGNTGSATSKSVNGVEGPLYCRVRAIDQAGNVGQWSEYNNTPPSTPTVTITPETPRTYESIEASASSTDEEGHSLSYQFQWLLSNQLQAEGLTLEASLTAKGQQWECRSWAIDSLGGRSLSGSTSFVIENSLPTQPVVELLPDPYEGDKDLVVDVQIYSTDPDGDDVAYDFQWFKSVDNGASWIHKVELDGSSSVSATYIRNDELWRVEYTPYEKQVGQQSVKGQTAPEMKEVRIDGLSGYDQLFTGNNHSPELIFNSLHGWIGNGVDEIIATWTASDSDEDEMSIDLFWTDKGTAGFVPLVSGLSGDQQYLMADVDLPADRPIYLYAVVTDAKGAITHVTSKAIDLTVNKNAVSNWILYR
ncbi:WD40 repeat domain-containing protein [bacterium]|nr:WD40 repeat domain-containing protein [bacterium]